MKNKNILKVFVANSIYKSDSVPNIFIIISGHNSNKIIDIRPVATDAIKASLNVSLTLLYSFAP